MSEYDDEYDTSEVICPYCKNKYEPECEDFNEEERTEQCEECGKNFHHIDQIEYSYSTRPDCVINGLEHKWESRNLSDGSFRDFCKVCGDIKPLQD